MYQFSRALYRELAPLVQEDRYGCVSHNRQAFLAACESSFRRLGSDRHYFAHPSRTLFNDVRFYFPISCQMRVYRTVERYMKVAAEYVDRREQEGVSLDGTPLSCHASTRKGTPCQRVPLPGSKYCPSHKHLEEDAIAVAA